MPPRPQCECAGTGVRAGATTPSHGVISVSVVACSVTWPIDRGVLVAPNGRGRGFLRITVERPPEAAVGDEVTVRVSSEVANFYPAIASRLSRLPWQSGHSALTM